MLNLARVCCAFSIVACFGSTLIEQYDLAMLFGANACLFWCAVYVKEALSDEE
jgi:hypothetical protein